MCVMSGVVSRSPAAIQTQDFGAVAAIHAAGLKGQIFAIHIGQRQHLRSVVQRNDGDDCVGARAFPCQPETVLCACDLEHDIRAAVTAVMPHELQRMCR